MANPLASHANSIMINAKPWRRLSRLGRSRRSMEWSGGDGRTWRNGSSKNTAFRLMSRAWAGSCGHWVSSSYRPGHVIMDKTSLPRCNTQAMQWHLEEISSQVSPGAHAILIVDRAGWHTTGKLDIPTNITLLPLPPKSPELNPVENIWQFMRDNWLSNRIFNSFDEIVAICCEAWNRLIDQPWKIMSIGLRKWAHGY